MRIGNLAGRLVIVGSSGAIDVEQASEGRFASDPQAIYDRWDEFRQWAAQGPSSNATAYNPADLGAPAPRPRQLFAIGLNYRDHVAESGFGLPDQPPVFTKFMSAITGPFGEIAIPAGNVDWEVELVVVMGKGARDIDESQAWDHIAGVTAGQDISERITQSIGPAPQFSLGKSFPSFAPMGPWLVTPDELPARDDLALGCSVNGEKVQDSRTSFLMFNVPALLQRLSSVLPLLPGDVIFTGTPAGVGMGRMPPRFLATGDELVTYIEGVGEMRHRIVARQ
jgi:2-keto-4-pentenoate hydratase/2-oxohepta-3-ene-1,7-dioic acid hydratase in catechol pathway